MKTFALAVAILAVLVWSVLQLRQTKEVIKPEIRYIEKPVLVEKPVEKVVTRTVYVDRPVRQVVYRDRTVYRDRIMYKPYAYYWRAR